MLGSTAATTTDGYCENLDLITFRKKNMSKYTDQYLVGSMRGYIINKTNLDRKKFFLSLWVFIT